MNNFDPEFYSISIRKELYEGELFYIARIQELPDVLEFGNSYEEARELALDTLVTSRELFLEQGIKFPEPIQPPENTASGRVTLRMPKSLHSRLIELAQEEEVSLNQYIVSALSVNYGQCSLIDKITNQIVDGFNHISDRVGLLNRSVSNIASGTYVIHGEFAARDLNPTLAVNDAKYGHVNKLQYRAGRHARHLTHDFSFVHAER